MKKYLLISPLFVLPAITYAAFTGTLGLINDLGDVVQQLTYLLAAIALLVFFWGIAKFIAAAGDETKIKEGKQLMIWGVIALFVMVSVWGLVAFIQDELGIQGGGALQVQLPPTG